MKNIKFPDRTSLRKEYEEFAEIRNWVIMDLAALIEEKLTLLESKPSIKTRHKDFNSYFKKYIKLLKNGYTGSPFITDIIGLRIVCPFLEDTSGVTALIKKHFEVIEDERKGAQYSFKEFGYESIHLLVKIPEEINKKRGDCGCEIAEIQIRTILQDAWAEVEHELVYKAEFTPFDARIKRKLAALNASLSLADLVFQEIRILQRQLNGQIDKRRASFFKKIEESIDGRLFEDDSFTGEASLDDKPLILPPFQPGDDSIDGLLLNALYAHNKNQFGDAIAFYSRILEMNPGENTASLIYKHRGMAFFAQSRYERAIDDFSKSLELDTASNKAFYYRGVVKAVLQRYSEAIDDFTQSLIIHPYHAFCLYRRGQAYYHIGDYSAALSDAEAAVRLDTEKESFKKFKFFLLKKMKM
ncbi:MAG: tetratricopeptide repeat protein [Treponema sp.]|jgi:putative GTP pyrophosphokinase|nr:tetratricopeptide repeat protein [Treponema sp.]